MTAEQIAGALEGRRVGHSWRCRCPVHGGRSLSVTDKDGAVLVYCQAGCGQEAVIEALRELGLWESREVRYSPGNVIRAKPKEAEGGLAERGITSETAARFGISEDAQQIRIPIRTPDGAVDGAKVRRKHPKPDEDRYYWWPTTTSPLFAHWPTVKQYARRVDGFLYLVEGVMDAIALTQAGLPVVAPVHGAGKYPEGVIETIEAMIGDGLGLIFIFAQNDIDGLKFADGWRDRLRALWPDDARAPYSSHVSVIVTCGEVEGVQVKDPADVLKVLGPARFGTWASAQTADYFWTSPVLQPMEWSLR